VSLVKNALRSIGVDVSRVESTLAAQRLAAIRRFAVDGILDVGANTGQYATELRRQGYSGPIVSVEPLREAYAQLTRLAAADRSWACVNCAVGREAKSVEILRAANSVSSSILPVTRNSTEVSEATTTTGSEQTQLRTLDSIFAERGSQWENPMLKVDTQRYELEVLLGAGEVLSKARAVEIELSFVELYRGQPLFFDVATRTSCPPWSGNWRRSIDRSLARRARRCRRWTARSERSGRQTRRSRKNAGARTPSCAPPAW
jgi:FkbM family methyltransferase